ncbi:MAG: hypothetical protein ACKPGB_29340, partial [Dolichospermum sp.]
MVKIQISSFLPHGDGNLQEFSFVNCQENNNHAQDITNFNIIWPMSDRLLQLLLIDPDPIFRLGLKVTLET